MLKTEIFELREVAERICSELKLDWGIRTLKLIEKFKLFKYLLFQHRRTTFFPFSISIIITVVIRKYKNWENNDMLQQLSALLIWFI